MHSVDHLSARGRKILSKQRLHIDPSRARAATRATRDQTGRNPIVSYWPQVMPICGPHTRRKRWNRATRYALDARHVPILCTMALHTLCVMMHITRRLTISTVAHAQMSALYHPRSCLQPALAAADCGRMPQPGIHPPSPTLQDDSTTHAQHTNPHTSDASAFSTPLSP